MRKLFWLVSGVVVGFVAAHTLNQTPTGHRFFEQVNRGVREFGDAVASGYRESEPAPSTSSAATAASDDGDTAVNVPTEQTNP